MKRWTTAHTALRLGETVRVESRYGPSFEGEVVALTPSTTRIKLSDGKLASLPAKPGLADKVYRLAE